MANIKNEVLNNLFRSTSNLQAFENFLASLPQFLQRPEDSAPSANGDGNGSGRRPPGNRMNTPAPANRTTTTTSGGDGDEVTLDLAPVRREMPKVGRNDPCPCGSGKKFKNCCGRTA